MTGNFIKLEGKSPGYRNAVIALGALALAGLIAFIISYLAGHQTFGSSNTVPWGLPIVLAIYLIGLSAGSLILSSLTYVFGREEYRPIARLAVFMAVVLIFGAMLAILVDLGRPEKFWRLFMFFYMNNMRSMFAINGILYGGYFVITLVYLGIIFAGKTAAAKITGIIAAGWAVLVHLGTGAIFGFIAAREAWFSSLRPLEFLAAALTSGVALLIVAVVATFTLTRRELKSDMLASLGRLLTVFIIVLLALVVIDKLTHLYAPERDAAIYMLAGPDSWVFWAFQIGLGAVVPLVILFNRRLNKAVRWLLVAAASVVVGVFFERYYLVITGAAYPQAYVPGNIEGVWGATGSFALMPTEIILAIGILAALGLFYLVGLKYLELAPAAVKAVEEAAPVSGPEPDALETAEEEPAAEPLPQDDEEAAS